MALPLYFGSGWTVEGCVDEVRRQGVPFAGLQWYGECWGGTSAGYTQVGEDECNAPCNANPGETCGGGWRNSVYNVYPMGGGGDPSPVQIKMPNIASDSPGYGFSPYGCYFSNNDWVSRAACQECGCTISGTSCNC